MHFLHAPPIALAYTIPFRVLICMDRFISSALGRPCAIHDEECVFRELASIECLLNFYYSFDLEMPIECDDEYWVTSDPDMAFKQPAGKPSTVTFFNCLLRLNQILAFALRTIVSGIYFFHGEMANKAFL